MSTTRIEAFQDRCIGAGNCVEVSPKYFDLDDDGLVVVLHVDVDASDEDEASRAGDICPAMAIELSKS
jgi:ferredoxin